MQDYLIPPNGENYAPQPLGYVDKLSEHSENFYFHQFQSVLMHYAYFSEDSPDPECRRLFAEAADWIEGKTRMSFDGSGLLLTFAEAMADCMNLEIDSLEFQERFAAFKRSFFCWANDPKLEEEGRCAYLRVPLREV